MKEREKKYIALWLVMKRECHRLVSRPLYLFCMVIAPLFCYIFFTTLMDSGLPTNMPVGAVDLDNSASSRNILRNLDAFGQTAVVARYSSVNEARTAMQEGKIYGFFYIPKGMSADAQSQRQPKLSFYTNNSYLIAGSLCPNLPQELPPVQFYMPREQRKIRRWDIYNPLSLIHIRYKILG